MPKSSFLVSFTLSCVRITESAIFQVFDFLPFKSEISSEIFLLFLLSVLQLQAVPQGLIFVGKI